MHMSNLKPDVFFCKRSWRIGHDVFEAFKALIVLLLLLVDYTEAEVDFIGLVKIGLHMHDLREGFFSMLEGAIAIVENANAVPQFGFLNDISSELVYTV